MSHIVVLGAGVMGSALCVPAADNGHQVTLVGSPLDDCIIDSILTSQHHPTLDVELSKAIKPVKNSECSNALICDADIIIIGVSSAGMSWACDKIQGSHASPKLVSLITKGLQKNPSLSHAPLTYAHTLPNSLTIDSGILIGIGGPCIARELALRIPTRVVFGCTKISSANALRDIFQTDYYRIKTTHDVVQLEACAALKNFLCIGVSSMLSAHPIEGTFAKNPVAALFNQAVIELRILSHWIAQVATLDEPPTHVCRSEAFDLAGMGDLHVTVGGGRNSRLGGYLGQGRRLDDLLQNELLDVTVEGVDTGKCLSSAVHSACEQGTLVYEDLPLTLAVLACIDNGGGFECNFELLPG